MVCLYLNFSNLILSNINYFTKELLKDEKRKVSPCGILQPPYRLERDAVGGCAALHGSHWP